jgi:hypothetical protein
MSKLWEKRMTIIVPAPLAQSADAVALVHKINQHLGGQNQLNQSRRWTNGTDEFLVMSFFARAEFITSLLQQPLASLQLYDAAASDITPQAEATTLTLICADATISAREHLTKMGLMPVLSQAGI